MIWAFLIIMPLFSEHVAFSQLVNKPPYFIPGSGDMSRFSLLENTPIDSPVYQLKGNLYILIFDKFSYMYRKIYQKKKDLLNTHN